MNWTHEKIAVGELLFQAILDWEEGNCAEIEGVVKANPWIVSDYDWTDSVTWIDRAVTSENVDVVRTLLDLGFNIDAVRKCNDSTALETAIDMACDDIVDLLIERGANVNIGRPVISAINRDEPVDSLRIVKQLGAHGLEVNQLYDSWGEPRTALDWAEGNQEIYDYLQSLGAKTAKELGGGASEAVSVDQEIEFSEVLDFCAETYGPIQKTNIIEIVPGVPPITVHVSRPVGEGPITVFTTGASALPNSAPENEGEFRFAEVFIQLPRDWPIEKLDDPEFSWPIVWLKKIARYPHEFDTWFGGPANVIANAEPISSSTRQSSFFVMAEHAIPRSDGEVVQLYRILPIYQEEYDLWNDLGPKVFFRKLDTGNVPFVVDIDRSPVVS